MADAKQKSTEGTSRRPRAETVMLHVRIPAELKAQAEAVLGELGISASDAIRVYYKQITLRGGLPFDVLIPNEETQESMRAADAGEGLLRRYDNFDDFAREMLGDP